MEDGIVLVVAIPIIFAVAIFIVIREIKKAQRLKESFSKIGHALNPDNPGSVTRSKFSGNIQGTVLLDGVECIFGYTPPTRTSYSRRPGVFKISLGCRSNGEFTIRTEGTMDRFSKKIGIASEVQTHDADFTDRFYIDSNDREFVSAFFASPESREAIRSLFDMGFETAVHDGKTMAGQWTGFEWLEEFDPEFVKEAILYLTALIDELPEPSSIGGLRDSYGASEKSSGGRIKLGILYATPFFAIFAMAVLSKANYSFVIPIDFMPFLIHTLRYSLPGLVLYMMFAMKVIRIGASSHRRILSLSSVSLVSFMILGFQLGTHLNVTQDPGPARVHTVQVAKKTIARSKDSTSYYAHAAPWPPRKETIELDVSRRIYRGIAPGRTSVTVRARPGGLGFEWIESFRFEGLVRPRKAKRLAPLFASTKAGNLEAVKRLLEGGADIRAENKSGFTALHYAARYGHAGLVRHLLSKGAPINARTKKGWTSLQQAVKKRRQNVLNILLEAGADVNIHTANGWSPLHQAVYGGDAKTVRRLLQKGANINVHTNKFPTPIYYASQKGSLEMAQILVKSGADIRITYKNWTPLRIADKRGFKEIASLLRKWGARK
ncbi:MAG: ankyrin repeat domain-containing protein [Nitrospinota bacterium]